MHMLTVVTDFCVTVAGWAAGLHAPQERARPAGVQGASPRLAHLRRAEAPLQHQGTAARDHVLLLMTACGCGQCMCMHTIYSWHWYLLCYVAAYAICTFVCSTQFGFDTLCQLVPSLSSGSSAKVSKAAILQKGRFFV